MTRPPTTLLLFCATALCAPATAAERPNILWITSEDNSLQLGCYGDRNAETPHLDGLAARGTRYVNFFANAPVCAVARSTWLLGLPAVSSGTQHMRSRYRVPEEFVPYAVLLKDAGYYVTNSGKTDYNTRTFGPKIWNACGKRAHYKNRPEGTPFFAVFNVMFSHESQIFPEVVSERVSGGAYPGEPRVPADAIDVPPYQVATAEAVTDHRRYHDAVTTMDRRVGKLLKELEDLGEADDTIVLYCSDHGGVTLRSKRFLFDSGTRVPLIAAFPEKWAHLAPTGPGEVSTRLTQFLDMPRTIVSLGGVDPPARMTGRVFAGANVEPGPETVFLYSGRFDESPDMSRGVTDGGWKYIRNYESDRPRFQTLEYPRRQLGQRSQWREHAAGRTNEVQSGFYRNQPFEELYDTDADPHEINNLAGDPAYGGKLDELRAALDAHMRATRDTGFLPETMMAEIDAAGGETIAEFCRDDADYPLARLMKLAGLAGSGDPGNLPAFVAAADDPHETVRYRALLGLRVLGEAAASARSTIEAALKDDAASVRIVAAACLGNLGETDRAVAFLLAEARAAGSDAQATAALDAIKYLDAPRAYRPADFDDVPDGKYATRLKTLLAAGGTIRRPPAE